MRVEVCKEGESELMWGDSIEMCVRIKDMGIECVGRECVG